MQEARQNQRISYQMMVEVFDDHSDRPPRNLRTRDVGLGGVYLVGAGDMAPGSNVHVAIADHGDGGLHLEGRVVRTGHDGAALQFEGNSAASMEVLSTLLAPKWDGENLLDGVVSMAPWDGSTQLAGWLRLTSLVSDWRRLTQGNANA
jgi:hypothetical protein